MCAGHRVFVVMSKCVVCGRENKHTAAALGVCPECACEGRASEVQERAMEIHQQARRAEQLPGFSFMKAESQEAKSCTFCSNACTLAPGERGACGVRVHDGRRLRYYGRPGHGLLHAYLDPNPTNCCNTWWCPAGTDAGGGRFSTAPTGAERDTFNLAVFFYGCNFHCVFCQNASHRRVPPRGWSRETRKYPGEHRAFFTAHDRDVGALLAMIDREPRVTCVCFFGGSPEPQLPFTLRLARRARRAFPDRLLRFCWEWNGAGNPHLSRACARVALETGGTIKFDLKAHTPALHQLLCGTSNARTLANFKALVREFNAPGPRDFPVVGATTLMVPYYVNAGEVEALAREIAAVNAKTPYSLLVFHPDDYLHDLPVTPAYQARRSVDRARRHLECVHVGNAGLLGETL